MTKRISAFIFMYLMFACSSPTLKKPDGLISETIMIDIITDLHIQQSLVNNSNNDATDIEGLAKNSLMILKSYNVTYANFESSYKYYSSQPENYKEILQKVRKRIFDQLSETEKQKTKLQTE